jgi:superfamily II DNA/RNA helicase
MTLEQLNAHLEGTLEDTELKALNELQLKSIAKVKQGGDCIFVSGDRTGKTTAIALSALVKAPHSYEGSPRVIIFSSTVDKAHQLHQQLSVWVRRTEISIELAHDKGNMVLERNNIFDGADILVANTRRLLDLYIQNGIHIGQLTLLIVDDATEIAKDVLMTQRIARLMESFPKCQHLLFTTELNPKVEKLAEVFCSHPVIMQFEDLTPFQS